MACALFSPAVPLQPYIRHYWQCGQYAPGQACPQFELPGPYPTLLCWPNPPAPQRRAGHPAAPVLHQWSLQPVSQRRQPLPCALAQGLFGIVFQPTGFYELFGVAMMTAGSTDPGPTGPAGHFVRSLALALADAATVQQQIAAAERLLLAQPPLGSAPLALQDGAANILRRHGQVNISELASQAHLCRRQFDRRFREVVGVAPKLFAEISRFHHAVLQLETVPWRSWQDVTHACGYFDQAHFNREFRRFASETPTAYRQQNRLPLLPITATSKNVSFIQ